MTMCDIELLNRRARQAAALSVAHVFDPLSNPFVV